MIELLEAILHAVALFFRVLYRLLFNPFIEFLLNIWSLFPLRENKKKKDL